MDDDWWVCLLYILFISSLDIKQVGKCVKGLTSY